MRAYADPELARLNTNYTRMPITAVQELVAMQRAVEPRLSELRVPLLVLGARRDRVVRPSSGATVHRRAGSADKRLVWFERSGHEMLRDLEREAVMDVVGDYLSERKAALATGRPDGPTLINPWMTAVRYAAIGRGHYESFYLKGNHPSRRLGVWLKFNLLEPVGAPDRLEGELWGVWFDGETGQHVVAQRVLPREGVEVRAGATMLRLGDAVLEHGRDALVERAQITGGDHQIAWDVRLEPMAPPVVHFPSRRLYEGGFPRKKILTPIPRGRLDGWIEIDGNHHVLDGWEGLHGHNWGREHAPRYAYGNGVFADGAYVDGFSARVGLGPVSSPWLSMLVVRLPDGRELPFNRPARWLSGHPLVDDERWELDLPGQGGARLRLAMTALRSDMVVLSYRNPDGQVGLCANTKFARGHLRVEERGRLVYEGSSERCELETFAATPRK
jgi:hypothetical protein